MPTATRYISEKRGTALAEEVLDTIEAEEAFNQRALYGSTHHIDKKNAWAQYTWGELHLDSLPPGTEIELVDLPKGSGNADVTWMGPLATIDSGVTCGTAMCFAGHAVTLAGDRMLFGVTADAARELQRKKGFKSNVKRFVNQFRRDDREHRILTDSHGMAAAVTYVLTREGKVRRIEERARELLGLSAGEADTLFSAHNDLHELRNHVQRMSAGFRLNSNRKVRR